MTKLLELLREHTARALLELDQAGGFNHRELRGTAREAAVKTFLRNFLPDTYGIESGEVFDVLGNISRQTDIIIYDCLHFIVLQQANGNIIVPCEGIYGGIEVKSILSADSLKDAIENIATLKSLVREKSDRFDFTPRTRFWLADSFDEYGSRIEDPDSEKMNSYFGIVIAREGLAQESAIEVLRGKALGDKNSLPDLVVNIERGYIICKYSREQPQLDRRDKPYEELLGLPLGEDTLPLTLLVVNAMTHQTQLRASLHKNLLGQLVREDLENATRWPV